MRPLTTAGAWLRSRAENIVVLLLGSMFATFILQIIFRYLLNRPLGWTVEYVALAWLWGILFGYAFVVRDADIIRLDLVSAAMPRPIRRAAEAVSGLVVVAILLWSLPKAWDYVTFMRIERTAYLRLPFDLVFSVYVPFVVSAALRALIGAWEAARGTGRHAPPLAHALESRHD